jgi:hypothetical protein
MDDWGRVIDHIECRYFGNESAYPLLRNMRRDRIGFNRVRYPRPHDAQYFTIVVFAAIYSGAAALLTEQWLS